jgi:hypothetical protein
MMTIEKDGIVKDILIILLFALSICSAQTDEKLQKSSPCSEFTSPEADCCDLVEWQNGIEKSIDSISIRAMEKSLKFHGESFEKIQASYSNFLSKMNVFVGFMAVFAALISIVVTITGWRVEKRSDDAIKNAKEQDEKSEEGPPDTDDWASRE